MKATPKIKKAIIILLFLVFFVALNSSSAPKGIKSFFYQFSEPIQNIFWRSGNSISRFWEIVFQSQLLEKENEQLKSRVLGLLVENLRLKDLEQENQVLRGALELELEKEFKMKVAKIVGKDISQDSIVINKGSDDGLSEGFTVITEQKVLVGKISEAYERFSRVTLLSSKDDSLDVQIKDKEIDGLIKGGGGFKLSLELIPKEKEISEGDVVITSYLSGKYPQGLLVGIIKAIKKQDSELFQMAEIEPFFNLEQAETLLIITNLR